MTLIEGSPCAKMVSFPQNLVIFLPGPAESRNDCTSKVGLLEFAFFLGEERSLIYACRVEEDRIKPGLGPKGEAYDVALIARCSYRR